MILRKFKVVRPARRDYQAFIKHLERNYKYIVFYNHLGLVIKNLKVSTAIEHGFFVRRIRIPGMSGYTHVYDSSQGNFLTYVTLENKMKRLGTPGPEKIQTKIKEHSIPIIDDQTIVQEILNKPHIKKDLIIKRYGAKIKYITWNYFPE